MKFTILLACLALFVPRAFGEAVSIDDVRSDYAKGDYSAVVTRTDKLFITSVDEPAPNDKYEMLMLRGESKLQLKDGIAASTAFKSAAKCAGNLGQFATAKANALVLDRSSQGKFTPTTGSDRTAIDVVPVDSRKQAMLAMKADLWSQNKIQINAGLNATTLPPIEQAFKPLSDMYFLESAGSGTATDTGQMMRDLGQQTYRLVQTEATSYGRRVEQINQMANSASGYGAWAYTRRGLTSTEKNELRNAGQYLIKLRDRANEYRGIVNKFEGDERRWDTLILGLDDAIGTIDGMLRDQ